MARRRNSSTTGYIVLGLGAAALYFMTRKSGAAATAPSFAPASPYQLVSQQSYNVSASQAARNASECSAAGGVWVKTGGLFSSEGICTDPSRSSAGCAQAGGIWGDGGCQFPGDTEL